MKNGINRTFLILADVITILASISFAFVLRQWCDCFERSAPTDLENYLGFTLIYAVIIILFYVEGIYTKRYDFWQELERLTKALFLAAVIVLALLAMTKQSESYSRFILSISFFLLALILPLQKYLIKNLLFKLGLWQHKATLIGDDPFFEEHVFQNPYLGYIKTDNLEAKTLFISSSKNSERLEEILHEALLRDQEVIFIPMVKNFDFSDAHIIHIFNARTNLIIVENNLMHKTNRIIKSILDYVLSFILLPLLLFFIAIIAFLIKKEEPKGSIFFTQKRMGQNGIAFDCHKFRSMREDGDALLNSYLIDHPEEIQNYEIYHKYDNDPRITRIGHFLRKTSLDELPQILNVIKGEMSLIGPRPYMFNEREKMGSHADIILTVKPGVTGLWQVSGRSDVDFMSRVDLDVWYVRNWSVWNDTIILIKTIQVVLLRKGAS
jgi:lipopolysaccharide/colanic/teichoic acid biosynthesis glycosyltransferase